MNMEQSLCKACYQTYFVGRMISETIEDLRSDWIEKLDIHSNMAIDLSGVECIDLAGLHLMLQMHEKAELDGKHIDFIGFNPFIRETLDVFRWFPDLLREKIRSRLSPEDGAA